MASSLRRASPVAIGLRAARTRGHRPNRTSLSRTPKVRAVIGSPGGDKAAHENIRSNQSSTFVLRGLVLRGSQSLGTSALAKLEAGAQSVAEINTCAEPHADI